LRIKLRPKIALSVKTKRMFCGVITMLFKYGQNIPLYHILVLSVLSPAVIHQRGGKHTAITFDIVPL
jgi:hypothetical protein